jgi:hypothetical protein
MNFKKLNQNKIYFILLLSISLSCNESIELISTKYKYKPPNDLRKVIPLELGNSWKYLTIGCGCTDCDTTLDSTTITDITLLDGKKVFRYYGISHHIGLSGEYFESIDSNDYSIYFCVNCFKTALSTNLTNNNSTWLPINLLKTPITEGHEWRLAEWDSLYGYAFGNFKIINTNATVYTSIGKFEHAIQIRQINYPVNWMSEYFIVPSIGVVKSSDSNGFGFTETELIEWKLNK